jgi:hypothetical protein
VGSLPYLTTSLGEFQAWCYVVALNYELQFLVKTVLFLHGYNARSLRPLLLLFNPGFDLLTTNLVQHAMTLSMF